MLFIQSGSLNVFNFLSILYDNLNNRDPCRKMISYKLLTRNNKRKGKKEEGPWINISELREAEYFPQP